MKKSSEAAERGKDGAISVVGGGRSVTGRGRRRIHGASLLAGLREGAFRALGGGGGSVSVVRRRGTTIVGVCGACLHRGIQPPVQAGASGAAIAGRSDVDAAVGELLLQPLLRVGGVWYAARGRRRGADRSQASSVLS